MAQYDALKQAVYDAIVEANKTATIESVRERTQQESKTFEKIADMFGNRVAEKYKKAHAAEREKDEKAAARAAQQKYAPTLANRMGFRSGGPTMEGFGGAAKGAIGGLGLGLGSLSPTGMIGKAITEIGGKANPAAMMMLNQAMDDFGAIAGRIVVPIMHLFTERIRLFGDFLATVMPSQEEFNQIFLAMKPAFDSLRTTLTALAPLFHSIFIKTLQGAVIIINLFATAIKDLLQEIKPFLKTLGFEFDESKPLVSSMGASGMGSKIQGLDAYGSSMIQAAFASNADPSIIIAENTKAMNQKMDQLIANTAPGDGTKRAMEGHS